MDLDDENKERFDFYHNRRSDSNLLILSIVPFVHNPFVVEQRNFDACC